MLAITSFSPEGYEKYGHKLIESIKNWPGKLIVYTEQKIGLDSDQILEQDFWEIPHTRDFYYMIEDLEKAHGKIDGGYNYNYDLNKFSKKVFCQWDALMNSEPGKVVWLDGDTIIKKPIPEDVVNDWFNDKGIVTFFRPGWHSETGFVGFDSSKEKFTDFLNIYIGLMKSGQVFMLPQWHDCAMLDFAVEASGVSFEDLSVGWEQKERYTLEDLKVFDKSKLKEYIEHKKGPKKC